jgi:tetratricopeptide (TPR) repeat protein
MSIKPIFNLITFLLFFSSCKETNEDLLDKALNYSKQKKYDKAIETYTKVINRNSKLQLAYYNRGFDFVATKQYDKALWDFNKVMTLQSHGDFIITFNQNSPFSDEETRTQVPYNDALYQRAQVKFYMDSLKSSFQDFQTLINSNYEKSNCIIWQGTLWIKDGKPDKACEYFEKGKQLALTADDKHEAEEMIKTYCGTTNNNR